MVSFSYSVSLTPPRPSAVHRLEHVIQTQMDQVDCPVEHHFAPHVYARKMTIPAGVVATGAVHKTGHITIVAKGHVALLNTEGDVAAEYHAGDVLASLPGLKRSALAFEDTVLVTIHPTDTTDLDELVEELTESKACELLGGTKNLQLEHQRLRLLEEHKT